MVLWAIAIIALWLMLILMLYPANRLPGSTRAARKPVCMLARLTYKERRGARPGEARSEARRGEERGPERRGARPGEARSEAQRSDREAQGLLKQEGERQQRRNEGGGKRPQPRAVLLKASLVQCVPECAGHGSAYTTIRRPASRIILSSHHCTKKADVINHGRGMGATFRIQLMIHDV